MKRKLAYILTLYFALIAYVGHAEERYKLDTRGPKVNVGIKAGFNSTIFFIDRFNTGGIILSSRSFLTTYQKAVCQ